jgi:hypothetical protein
MDADRNRVDGVEEGESRRREIEEDVLRQMPALRYNRAAINAMVEALAGSSGAPPEPVSNESELAKDLEEGAKIYRERHGNL